MTDSYNPDRPVICPYNSSHIIAGSRLQKHLIKCAKNYPPDYRVICHYNATHRVPKEEIEQHIFNCPDRKYFQARIYEHNHIHGACRSWVDNGSTIEYDEFWDDDEDNILELPEPTSEPLLANYNIMCKPSVPNSAPSSSTRQLRQPSGFAVAMMMDQSGEESGVEDMESVKSFMAVGRGKKMCPNTNNIEKIQLIGRGRGSSQVNIK